MASSATGKLVGLVNTSGHLFPGGDTALGGDQPTEFAIGEP
jgi:hypothetical protein